DAGTWPSTSTSWSPTGRRSGSSRNAASRRPARLKTRLENGPVSGTGPSLLDDPAPPTHGRVSRGETKARLGTDRRVARVGPTDALTNDQADLSGSAATQGSAQPAPQSAAGLWLARNRVSAWSRALWKASGSSGVKSTRRTKPALLSRTTCSTKLAQSSLSAGRKPFNLRSPLRSPLRSDSDTSTLSTCSNGMVN